MYLSSSVSSTESDVNIHLAKAQTAIDDDEDNCLYSNM